MLIMPAGEGVRVQSLMRAKMRAGMQGLLSAHIAGEEVNFVECRVPGAMQKRNAIWKSPVRNLYI